jgi:pimeloyl-ACP methyl ester carboxylesterase
MSDFHDAAERLASELPTARLHRIAEAGHLAPLECPVAVRKLLLDLVAETAGETFPT